MDAAERGGLTAADLLDAWREAERTVDNMVQGSRAWEMARRNADRARDLFHERENEARAEQGREIEELPALVRDGELLRQSTA